MPQLLYFRGRSCQYVFDRRLGVGLGNGMDVVVKS
jgi:hypothetical protein